MSTTFEQPNIEQQAPSAEETLAAEDKAVINEAVNIAEASGHESAEAPATPDSPPASMLIDPKNLPTGYTYTKIEGIKGRQGVRSWQGSKNRSVNITSGRAKLY